MASHDPTALLQKLKLALPDCLIDHFARTTGFVERHRDLDTVVFVWTLILGFSCGATRSLAGMARAYQRATGSSYNRSSFYRRFDHDLLEMMRQLYAALLDNMPHTPLGPFARILALDATIVRLWNGLLDTYESTNSEQAALKTQFIFNVADMSAHRLKVHSSRDHEVKKWRSMGRWVANCLMLMDLGYYSFWHFHNINSHGGFFLSRLKSNCALRIVEDMTKSRGRRAKVAGMTIRDALGKLRGKGAHWLVEVPVTLNSGREVVYHWRVIVELNEDTGEYHTYLTNAPESMISCEDARGLYALRWQIELAFKGLKSVGRLHQLPSSKDEIVQVLILAALMFMMVSGWLRHSLLVERKLYECSILRAMLVVREYAVWMLGSIGAARPGFEPRCGLELLREQLPDPNGPRVRAFAVAPIVEHSCAHAA